MRHNEKAAFAASNGTFTLGLGGMIVLVFVALVAFALFAAIIVWLIPFLLIVVGVYLVVQSKHVAGFLAVGIGFILFIVGRVL